MFIFFLIIVIFSLGIISFNKRRSIQNKASAVTSTASTVTTKATAVTTKDTSEPVFESITRQISDDMSTDKNTAAKHPPKQSKGDVQELNLEEDMNKARIEELSHPSSPRSRKSATMKINCLCAPTNHPGSFRCRYHRNSMSVGSNLNELAFRKTASVGANLSDLGEDTTASGMKRSRRPREC